MPAFPPPGWFGIQVKPDPYAGYWSALERERQSAAQTPFKDFGSSGAAPKTPGMSAPPAGGNAYLPPGSVTVTRPSTPVATPPNYSSYAHNPAYLVNPMRIVNDNDILGAIGDNPNLLPMIMNAAAYPQAAAALAGGGQAGASGGGGGGSSAQGWNIPYGVDPNWYKAFAAEHDGKTPEEIYKRDGDYAIAHALSDKAWGEQFYRTYGRPPSEYDWKASYNMRQRDFYGG